MFNSIPWSDRVLQLFTLIEEVINNDVVRYNRKSACEVMNNFKMYSIASFQIVVLSAYHAMAENDSVIAAFGFGNHLEVFSKTNECFNVW
jgi:hypothetical protein